MMLLDTFAIFYRLRIARFYGPQVVPLAGLSQAPAAGSRASGPDGARSLGDTRGDSGPTDGPLRILAYNWRDLAHPRAGGAEVYLQSVAREWVQRGHEVTVFSAAVADGQAEELVDGVRVIRRGGRIGVYREARRYWRREGAGQYDLVLDCVNTRPFLCPRFVRDVPVMALIHQVAREVWHYETPWPIALVGRYLLEPVWLRAYRDVPVVTVSESSRESLAEYGLRRVTVVPEGWVPAFPAPVKKEPVPTVVFIGRLSANKRPEHAIRAFGLARRQLPEAQMWVIGSGPEEARLRKMAGPGVTFLGHVPEEAKRERLGRAHALVATSVREGWGLVVTEAAASGTVAIGYDVGGPAGLDRSVGRHPHAGRSRVLATGLVGLLPSVAGGYGPRARPAGVVPWAQVAAGSSQWRTSPSRPRSRFLTRPDRLLATGLLVTARGSPG